jgi:hypothetical protein
MQKAESSIPAQRQLCKINENDNYYHLIRCVAE